MSKVLFILLVLTALQVVRVASFNLTISPDHVRVNEAAQTVVFTCSADVVLAGCQVNFCYEDITAGPLLELSRGSQSQADPTHLGSQLTGYSYSGSGLADGDCGVSLQLAVGPKHWIVACRVRAERGGWMYAWANLYADSYGPIQHTLISSGADVLPGGEARYMFKAEEPLSFCRFFLPGVTSELVFDKGAGSNQSTSTHLYLGAGLQSGECGLQLTNIREANNGPVRGYIRARTSKDELRYMAFILASPPSAPTLTLIYAGNNVTATCEVRQSRPVANISWVLGDAVIREDVTDDYEATAQDEWRWPWMTGAIKQTLTLQLQPQHHGQVLKCVVSHVALVQPLEAERVISYAGPTAASIPSTTASTTTITAPGPNCLATNYLDLLCREYRVRPSQHGNTSCLKAEVHEYRIREAGAAARTAEIEEETAKVKLEGEKIAFDAAKVALESAKSRAKTDESRATASQLEVAAARSRARAEGAWAQNAEEELQFERERRTKSLQHSQSPQSQQG